MKRNVVNGITALMVILVLFIPIMAGYTLYYHKETVILTAGPGDTFLRGYVHASDPMNQTNSDDLFESPSWDINHYEAVNDSALIGETGMFNKDIAYLNTVSNVGNSTVITGVNYSLLDQSPDYYFYEIDLSAHEITEYDYFIIETTGLNHTGVGLSTDPGSWQLYNIPIDGENRTYSILGYTIKANLLADDDWPVFVVFGGIDITDSAWAVEISYYELSDSAWAWEDNQLFGLSVMAMICIFAVTIALNTDTIDIFIDKNRKNRK